MPSLERFASKGKLVIGICNGFQILVKAGLLPGNNSLEQEVTLTINDSAKFEDRWVYLKSPGHLDTRTPVKCVWASGLPEIIYLPVAHGEGKFVARDAAVLARLKNNNQVVFRYCDAQGDFNGYPDNPNGSQDNIAGICDETGRIFGLMPHPERHADTAQHPHRHRIKARREADGLLIFKNGVEYARKNF